MGNIGSGLGSSYPTALDTQTTQEVNSPNASKTLARAEVPNDIASAVIAVETTLGTNPHGTASNLKTYLQVEHNLDGTHHLIDGHHISATPSASVVPVSGTDGSLGLWIPPGIIWQYGGSVAPAGWLLCDGSEISRTTYADLYAIIGTAFGVGNGTTTFNLPNSSGRALIGAGRTGTSFTVTIASPAVFTCNAHGLIADWPIVFETTGSLPTGLTAGTVYYVSATDLLANTFKVSTTVGGAVVNTSGTQSGSHTWFRTIGSKVGRIGGANEHLLNKNEVADHTHTIVKFGSMGNSGPSGIGINSIIIYNPYSPPDSYGVVNGESIPTVPTTSYSHNNIQPSLVVNYIIKY